jgi:hypothetical protein
MFDAPGVGPVVNYGNIAERRNEETRENEEADDDEQLGALSPEIFQKIHGSELTWFGYIITWACRSSMTSFQGS